GGVDASSLNVATKARRKELEAFVDRAVKALAKFDDGAEKRRPEIRGIVDQLSRHPDLVERWVDGSLRVLPDDEFGFGSFAGMEVTTASQPKPQPQPETKPEPKSRSKAVRPPAAAKQTVSKADRAAERATERQARAAHAERARKARHAVAVAARALSTADRELDTARSALRQAEAAVQLAEEARRDAEQRHETARLAASHLADSN
ncbi:MAG: hypothetical protein ABIZ69_08965, partial [Ilumatobacteraceae bacterium]